MGMASFVDKGTAGLFLSRLAGEEIIAANNSLGVGRKPPLPLGPCCFPLPSSFWSFIPSRSLADRRWESLGGINQRRGRWGKKRSKTLSQ